MRRFLRPWRGWSYARRNPTAYAVGYWTLAPAGLARRQFVRERWADHRGTAARRRLLDGARWEQTHFRHSAAFPSRPSTSQPTRCATEPASRFRHRRPAAAMAGTSSAVTRKRALRGSRSRLQRGLLFPSADRSRMASLETEPARVRPASIQALTLNRGSRPELLAPLTIRFRPECPVQRKATRGG